MRDTIEPGRKSAARVKPPDVYKRFDEYFLNRVLGVLIAEKEPPRVAQHLPLIARHKHAEKLAFAALHQNGDLLVGLRRGVHIYNTTTNPRIYFNSLRRSSTALIATMTVERDMRTAAKAGSRIIPLKAKTPAASGMATTL